MQGVLTRTEGVASEFEGQMTRLNTALEGAMGSIVFGDPPTTESLVLKVRQHLPNLRLPGNIPDVNTWTTAA